MAKAKLRSQGKKLSTIMLIFWTLFMLTLVTVFLLALGIVYLPNTSDDSSTTDLSSFRRKTSKSLAKRKEQWTEILSWEPRAFIYHNFLSKEECEYMINLAKPFMEKSSVVNSKTGKSTKSRILVNQWCIKPLCDIPICHNPRIVTCCLEGLENISEADKNVSGVNLFAQIENLQSHDNIEIYEKAVRILETYWLEKDDETMPAGEGFNFGGSEVPSVPTGGFNFN